MNGTKQFLALVAILINVLCSARLTTSDYRVAKTNLELAGACNNALGAISFDVKNCSLMPGIGFGFAFSKNCIAIAGCVCKKVFEGLNLYVGVSKGLCFDPFLINNSKNTERTATTWGIGVSFKVKSKTNERMRKY